MAVFTQCSLYNQMKDKPRRGITGMKFKGQLGTKNQEINLIITNLGAN